ncbi:SesB-related regulatory protein [Lasiodiplodia theobromae]|uniref:SesB-related regulatory protein n=1 Tax=Lasiodiplodia theobromae TaxID=45133 RepID=UPI0015C3CB15|nr:SesB-related regulatory protein [Lasiodiplodia theobromae]KAF4535003.1 SesB-related regulatory protein [Lasiodiplodia theobromae]
MFSNPTVNSKDHEVPDVLSDPADATVDIVFVHGPGGDKEGTWTWISPERSIQQPERVFWPRDLLPKDLPHARIISFGYDASFAHFYPFYGPRNVPQGTTLDDHSTALFQRLIALEDESSSKRPIIFVTHSLGGLVTANALSRPNGTDSKKDEIANRTVGVIFLGTPFEGSEKASWAAAALRLLSFVSSTNDEKIKDLEERSAKLVSINDSFYKYLKKRDRLEVNKNFLEVACFFEEYPMKIGGKKMHIVPKESACLNGVDPQSISAHHSDMCKFEDEYRNGYKCILGQLQLWIRKLSSVSSERKGISQVVKHFVLSVWH